jgi:hypothetical protein
LENRVSELQLPKFSVLDPVKSDALSQNVTPCLEAQKLGLTRYELIARKGSITVILTQAKHPITGREEPALVLANTRDPRTRHAYILLSQLYQVCDPKVMTTVAPQIAEKLFGFVTRHDLFLVADCIFDYAEDLQKAKPARQMTSRQWLEAIAQDGFVVHHQGEAKNG